jgi:hypothetical protein
MLISTALLLDSNIRNSVCTPAKLPRVKIIRIVIYIRVREVNFPARQLVSVTIAQSSG